MHRDARALGSLRGRQLGNQQAESPFRVRIRFTQHGHSHYLLFTRLNRKNWWDSEDLIASNESVFSKVALRPLHRDHIHGDGSAVFISYA